MNFFESFLHALDGKMTTPTPYGWFHLLSVALVIGLIVLTFIFRNKINKKVFNIIILSTGILFIVLEIYKQLNFSYNGTTDTWSYQWYAFPFQFCSTPMYVMLLAGILRKGKLYDACLSFLATFSLVAGVMVMILPTTVFISTIGINIQTMIVHGGMIVIAFLIYFTKSIEFNVKSFLKSFYVFLVVIAIAQILNIVIYHTVNPGNFNMFFVSPYQVSSLPVFDIIYTSVPYIVFFLIYLIVFAGVSCGCVYSAKGITKLYDKVKASSNKAVLKDEPNNKTE